MAGWFCDTVYITVTTAVDMLVGNMLGVHTTVKVIGLMSPAATRGGNILSTIYKYIRTPPDRLNLRFIAMVDHISFQSLEALCTKYQILLLCSNIL